MEIKWIIVIAVSILFSFLIGFFLGKKICKKHYDGQLIIGEIEDREQFQFIFSTELEDLRQQTELCMQIVKAQNSQPI